MTLINVMSKCFLKERLCGVISRYFWTLSFIPSDNDFAKDRQYTLIYDGNASTDYETIGTRLIMQKLFELFFAILNAHSNMCTQGNIVQFLLKRVRTIGCKSFKSIKLPG